MEPYNEKITLERFHGGDIKAFEYIYNRFFADVFIIARKYLHDEQDAKDIRQSCFIKLWEAHNKYKFESMKAVFVWLRQTTANRCIDQLRAVKIHEGKEDDIKHNYIQQHNTEIFEATEKEAAILNRLNKSIHTLPEKCKEVFLLRWGQELKFTEISVLLSADVSTVKKRYARAIKLLKDSVGKYIVCLLVL